MNKSYNNSEKLVHHGKSNSNYINNSNSPKTAFKNIKKINLNNLKSNYKDKDILNKSEILMKNNSSTCLLEKKQFEHDTDVLKKILINKINNQINEIIEGKEKVYFNENNKLFFLGFCDILFELGFLHIKETEIVDISKIKNHLNNLCTQPYTNRAVLSEKFLYNEQQLLISAWKTILNNFNLIQNIDSLPQENEEITIDDCKLFVFIVTGLFIGYNNNYKFDKNLNSDRKPLVKNKSFGHFNLTKNLKKANKLTKKNYRDVLNHSYNKNNNNHTNSEKKNKYHFRKKSENSNINNSINTNNENILKKIMENRKKSDYNYKNILKIKNYFTYFAELRKLYNLYKKDLKNINKKIEMEKDLTFKPKTNKNNKELIDKFAPSMNFFERNKIIKNRNDKKKIILQKESSQKMLKECTFEPCQKTSKLNKTEIKNPREISNRLYYNYSSRREKSEYNITSGSNKKLNDDKLNNSEYNSNKNRIYSKAFIRKNKFNKNANYHNYNSKIESLKNNLLDKNLSANSSCSKIHTFYKKNIIKPKEIFYYSPRINKKFNRGMFSQSPLSNDELLNRRIKNLRETNYKKFLDNYEKNSREVISNDIKNNEYLLKELMSSENKYMRMDIEKKTNKDTFENFQNFDIFNNDNNNNYYNIPMNEPLFTVEIKVKQNIKTIEVYQGDDPEQLAYAFCIENMLGKGSFEKIVEIIKSKLEEINSGMFNENVNYSDSNLNQEQDISHNKNELKEKNNINEKNDINNQNNNGNNIENYNENNLNNNDAFKDKSNNTDENNNNSENQIQNNPNNIDDIDDLDDNSKHPDENNNYSENLIQNKSNNIDDIDDLDDNSKHPDENNNYSENQIQSNPNDIENNNHSENQIQNNSKNINNNNIYNFDNIDKFDNNNNIDKFDNIDNYSENQIQKKSNIIKNKNNIDNTEDYNYEKDENKDNIINCNYENNENYKENKINEKDNNNEEDKKININNENNINYEIDNNNYKNYNNMKNQYENINNIYDINNNENNKENEINNPNENEKIKVNDINENRREEKDKDENYDNEKYKENELNINNFNEFNQNLPLDSNVIKNEEIKDNIIGYNENNYKNDIYNQEEEDYYEEVNEENEVNEDYKVNLYNNNEEYNDNYEKGINDYNANENKDSNN